jgi:hypothetical protein
MHVPFFLAAIQSLNHAGILQLTLTGDPHPYHFPFLGP